MEFLPVDSLLAWLSTHPALAGALVFAIAFLESLALVGLFMPGAVLMFIVGAVIGAEALPFWPMYGFAAAGAVAGDGVSFFLGRRLHGGLSERWPFRAHPQWLESAGAFFRRHGGKSVLFGRFVGPIRPVIPAVAGMMDMPAGRFFLINVVSALLWAPAYLLPGVVFGASLSLAAEVATRLALLLLVLATTMMLAVWSVRATFRFMQPRAQALIQRGLGFARAHPVAGRMLSAVLDPQRRETAGLALLAATLAGASAIFLVLLDKVGVSKGLAGADMMTYHALQWLRTPWVDHVMVVITALGDWQVLLAVFAVLLAWLLWHRRWSAALHWCAAAAFAQVLIQILKATTAVARPAAIYSGSNAFAFPSGHATSATVIYGFLAVLIARELPPARRWIAYATVAPPILVIAFSRLYLGVHWLSDVLGGLSLGLAWVALLGIAYRRHPAATLPWRRLVLAALATLSVAAALHVPANFTAELQRYRVEPVLTTENRAQWWKDGWRSLPAVRQDLRGRREHPLNVQYAGNLDRLQASLAGYGWHTPVPLDAANWLLWFGGGPLEKLPLLPQVHDGRHETLLLVKPADHGRLYALRLWESGRRLAPGGETLWIGTASIIAAHRPFPGVTLPRTAGDFALSRATLARDLAAAGAPLRVESDVLLVDGSNQLSEFDHGTQAFETFERIIELEQ